MPNKLQHENSPYLQQHQNNPVDWYPWGEEALALAKKENKPIFLSIGYAACHWCHVMAHESFEDEETAKIMNELFVNIKVDREERPDLDNIYMSATQAMTGQGGWPMSVFLMPDGKPFYAGTYFPPTSRYNLPSFKDILTSIAKAWSEDLENVTNSSNSITEHIQQIAKALPQSAESINEETINRITLKISQSYDWQYGGWGAAPKFPQAMTLRYLLQRAAQGDKMALDIAENALSAMAIGGMYDLVGGGFARYSVDNYWLVPHFEKMLYDNAHLSRVYLHAYLITQNPQYKKVCEETLDFIIREMRHPEGGFYSSLDADSEGVEGKFYVFTFEEIKALVEDAQDFEIFSTAHDLTEQGNFEGNIVLQRALSTEELSQKFNLTSEETENKIDSIYALLLKERDKRIRPGTDDKVLTAWNAWMLIAFAEAARYLDRPDYLEVAKSNAEFLLNELKSEDILYRSWRNNNAANFGYLEDYASLALGLLSLYQSDPSPRWYIEAKKLTDNLFDLFKDEKGGFFDNSIHHEDLLFRPKYLEDNATPSGNSLAAELLTLMTSYTNANQYDEYARKMFASTIQKIETNPIFYGQWNSSLLLNYYPIQEIAIIGNPATPDTIELSKTVWQQYRPSSITAIANLPLPEGSPPLLEDRTLISDKPTAYVCENFVCALPVTSPKELKEQLSK